MRKSIFLIHLVACYKIYYNVNVLSESKLPHSQEPAIPFILIQYPRDRRAHTSLLFSSHVNNEKVNNV